MAYSNTEGTVFSAVSMAASYNSDAIETRNHSFGQVQLAWSSYNGSGDFSIELSNDNTNWDTYPNSLVTLSAASGSQTWILNAIPSAFIRMKYTRSSGSTGTMTLTKMLKGL